MNRNGSLKSIRDRTHNPDVEKAMEIALDYGDTDGSRHKMWVIDQMLRALAGDDYDRIISDYESDVGYEWDTGTAP